jgi:hypothetical protein
VGGGCYRPLDITFRKIKRFAEIVPACDKFLCCDLSGSRGGRHEYCRCEQEHFFHIVPFSFPSRGLELEFAHDQRTRTEVATRVGWPPDVSARSVTTASPGVVGFLDFKSVGPRSGKLQGHHREGRQKSSISIVGNGVTRRDNVSIHNQREVCFDTASAQDSVQVGDIKTGRFP